MMSESDVNNKERDDGKSDELHNGKSEENGATHVDEDERKLKKRSRHDDCKDSRRRRTRSLSSSRSRSYSSDDSYLSSDEDSYDRRRRRKKHRHRNKDSRHKRHSKKRRKHDHKKKKHKKSRRRSRSGSYDSYSSDSDASTYSSSSRGKKKSSSKRRKHSKKSSSSRKDQADNGATTSMQNSFGKYGIVRESDFHKKQRSFQQWLADVKGIPISSGNIPKGEMMEYFREYAEDFNTATLPHIKYYDFDTWEMEDYERQKSKNKAISVVKSDEWEYQEEQRRKAKAKQEAELNRIKTGLMGRNRDQLEDMKRQSYLKAELANAYKVGDEEKVKRLQRKLEPEK